MKAISLWQPWATLMCDAASKRVETRSWHTSHRGDLVICASKRKPSLAEFGGSAMDYQKMLSVVPFGAAVCVVSLYDCRPVEEVVKMEWFNDTERSNGDYTEGQGRFGWITKGLRVLKQPVPVIGRQGLWNLPPETEVLVRAQLP